MRLYKQFRKPGAYKVNVRGTRFVGFDTDHPGLLVDFAVLAEPAGMQVYSEYIPLTGSKSQIEKSVSKLRSIFEALTEYCSDTAVEQSDRPLTLALNLLPNIRGTCKMTCYEGRNARGARIHKILWGDKTPLEVVSEVLVGEFENGLTDPKAVEAVLKQARAIALDGFDG
jgi:hypothetical protein